MSRRQNSKKTVPQGFYQSEEHFLAGTAELKIAIINAGGTVIVTKLFGFCPGKIYSQRQQIEEKIIYEYSKQF